jgi:FKBP-type peptidyl-prolyl cis-trans isomerase SlyD
LEAQLGKVVSINYTLTLDDGETLGQENGVEYLHGYRNILTGLEKGLEGAVPGDKRSVTVEPAEGYGEYDPERVFSAPIDSVPDGRELQPDMWISANTSQGAVQLKVVEVKDDAVVFDGNHPLAGQRLHFETEVVDVRHAQLHELTQGAPGPEAKRKYG